MNIDILSLWAQFKIAELIELKDKFIKFILRPLFYVPEVKESFLDDLSLVTSCFDKF